jgi:hypothetical protein
MVAGPEDLGGNLLLGSYILKPDGSVDDAQVALVKPAKGFDKVWKESIAGARSATGDLVVDGDVIDASSNFTVAALDSGGKKLWDAEGKEEALSPGSMRGVRFAGSFRYRYWGGRLLAVAGDRFYLATTREVAKKTWADVITVLDKRSGAYLETLDVKAPIVDMATAGGHLVLATSEGLQILSLD